MVGRDEARGTQRVDVASHPHSKSPRKAEAVREGARQPMERMVTCQLHVSYMSQFFVHLELDPHPLHLHFLFFDRGQECDGEGQGERRV